MSNKTVVYKGGLGEPLIINFAGGQVVQFFKDKQVVLPSKQAAELLETEYFREVIIEKPKEKTKGDNE